MASHKVGKYQMVWNHSEQEGKFRLQLDDGSRQEITVKSSGEFVAVATVLNSGTAIYYDSPDGIIGTEVLS